MASFASYAVRTQARLDQILGFVHCHLLKMLAKTCLAVINVGQNKIWAGKISGTKNIIPVWQIPTHPTQVRHILTLYSLALAINPS